VGKGRMGSLTIQAGSVKVDVIDEGQLVGRVHEWGGKFEPQTLAAWATLARRGSEVIDVGAHTGIFSIAAAKLGARPVAIEPLPFLVERIKENARLNGVKFYICEAAASDVAGESVLGYLAHIHHPYGASILRKDKPDHTRLKVKSIRLDDLKMSNVSAIKIDVERYELSVLKGARKLIERERPAIILEVLNDRAFEKITTHLGRFGYRLDRRLDRRNILMVTR
jgi:FkbM family methyltransferase